MAQAPSLPSLLSPTVSRVTGEVSVDLYWSMEGVQIQVGDSVFWEFSNEVHEFTSLQSVTLSLALESDIVTENLVRGESMRGFQFTFRRTGSFILTSVATPIFEIREFVVNVTGPQASISEVEVFVGEEKALVVDPAMSRVAKRQSEDCGLPAVETEGTFVVGYSPCLTPSVTTVEPRMGFRLETVFTIQGTQFSTTPELNKVMFDGYPCITLTSNETTLTCLLDETSGTPPTYTRLPISVRVVDLGNAQLVNKDELYVVLQSYITGVDPAYGSLEGGTDLVVHGDGFPTDTSSVISVGLGRGRYCIVTSSSYTEVACTTESSGSDSDEEVTLTVTVSSDLIAMEMTSTCLNYTGCNFTYSDAHTPKVASVRPISVSSLTDTTFTITGTGFIDYPSSTTVMFGDAHGYISNSSENTISVLLPPQPARSYPVRVKVCPLTGGCIGYAQVLSAENTTVVSEADIISVSPTSGSVWGGTEITITGRGFNTDPEDVQVLIGNSVCDVWSVNYSTIMCITLPQDAGSYNIQVSITDLCCFPEAVTYNYSMESTPVITGISPSSGTVGTTITLTGSGLDGGNGMVGRSTVLIDEAECVISAISDTSITCTPENYFVGTYPLDVTIDGKGMAAIDPSVEFTFILSVSSVQPSEGSLAGGSGLIINGTGFFPADIEITVCGDPCLLSMATPRVDFLECILPPMDTSSSSDLVCDLIITTVGVTVNQSAAYTYRVDMTPRVASVNRTRGGTGGGSVLLITGQGFDAPATVTIAGSECELYSQSDTEIVCVTGESGRNVRTTIMVFIEGKGFAASDVEFWYVDLWSSPFTWQDGIIPSAGDFVVVPRGQTLVLDVVTPVLGYILIQGGTLIFDPEKGDNEVELHTQGGLITSGGVFQVGTEDEPYMSKTQIVLYGHVLSTEIPVYGAKTLALRKGTLDIHGRTLNTTWTRLSTTAAAGSSQLHLQEYVDWDIGGTVVIASTSFSQRENEEKVIQSITAGNGGSVITLTEPLDYEHISIQQTIAGRFIDTSAEVGYLTRNVVIRGNLNEEWVEEVPACPTEFRVGQFDLQTCFQGRFGAETVNDQFGSQVMIHAESQNRGDVRARFGYVEVTHAGQAFRLGRYPIHFHLNGDVTGSYVRGCGIHHTFNRAVTMHAIDHLLVEKNVAYNIMGHAYFLEDGNEQHNIIQDNLGIFVRASSSLLNVDITPATFWVVNPNNILRRNAAAGGTHFGFWYRLPQHPEGPSATTSVCPRRLPLEEFSDNSAHSFGWYGLWVFRQYHPSVTGSCNDNTPAPAYYDRFLAWRNDKGVEFEQAGSLQIRDSIMMDNTLAGIEITDVTSIWSGENDDGPLVKDTLIVGYSDVTTETGSSTCSVSGIKTPHSYYLTVSNVTFANFDRSNCFPVQPCSFCRHPHQGGFETRFKQISYINAGDDITRWNYFHEHAQRDLDGTLTGTGRPSVLVPFSKIYPPALCQNYTGSKDGMICEGEVEFGRIGIHDPFPNSLRSTQLKLMNDYGADLLPFEEKRFRGGPGQMAIIPLNDTYQLTWILGVNFTNITYSIVTAGFEIDDYVIFRQQYPRRLDFTSIRGVTEATNVSTLEDPASANTGDWTVIDNTTLLYIVKGTEQFDADESITFSTYRCFYENCVPPPPPTEPPLPTIPPPRPPGRPDVTQSWSNSSIWPDGVRPQAGDDVTISSDMYVVVDKAIPRLGKLIINGGLELSDAIDHMIEVDFLIVDGGSFVIGYPSAPFEHEATIMLYGDQLSEEIGNKLTQKRQSTFFTNVGAKAMAVFGDLIIHGVTRTPTWTTLAETAVAGSNTLVLSEPVTWVAGDTIVVTSTSYNAYETEKFVVTSVVNTGSSSTVQLDGTLSHTHSGGYFTSLGDTNRYTTRAEVGLLTRNIKITNNDNARAESEAFGCRVVVSQNAQFTAKAQIEGVEFSGCGQLGYTDDFDPRFALAILNIDDSYVRDCSVHDGYNTGIGVFDSNGVEIYGNVVHNTVGASVIATGNDHNITKNLGSLSQFLGTFRNRNDDQDVIWTANFKVIGVDGLTLVGNAAAGGAKVGFHTNGGDCSDSPSNVMRDNTAHSVLHGVHLEYGDGLRSGCSRFSQLNIFSCYFFGLFSYSVSGIQLYDSTFTNNKAAVYVSVTGPGSLSHVRSTKTVQLERVLIISAGEEFTCEDDTNRPAIADHPQSHSGILAKSGGHVGVVMPNFLSSGGHYPQFEWWSITSYPAIAGLTEINQVTFANFHMRCGNKLDTVLRTHPGSDDANHPIHLSQITFVSDMQSYQSSVNSEGKLFVQMPSLGKINPADCVDMDCDGYKAVLIKDIGGTFTETGSDRSIVSMAEFEWDGDMRRGLGDYRIPRTMLSFPNGSRIETDSIYPNKGIPRSENCPFNTVWNIYVCADIEHVMLVLESLDPDTEVRRLSPVGIGANSYINLVNGPQDNGWCGGYTCQERISTFYSVVATGLHYTIALTSTNPQNFAMYMLNAREDQAIVSCIIYTNPQRLDVYYNGEYVVPNNAERGADGNLRYLPEGQFERPQLTHHHGANHYDRSTKQLCITMRGDGNYEIRTTAVIVLSLNVQVTVSTFFDPDTIVRNIALLLGIPSNRIRVVSISRETSRRKRQADGTEGAAIEFEVGDPPQETLETPTEAVNMTDTGSGMNATNMTDSGTGDTEDDLLTFEELEELSEMLVTIVQTGEIVNALNVSANLTSATIDEPEPPPVDETDGVRATPETGGPQPDDFANTTAPPTFSQIQREEEEVEQNETTQAVFSIPTTLSIVSEPVNDEQVIEGVPLGLFAPQLVILDNNGQTIVNLGLQISWVLTVTIATAPEGAFLTQSSANFTMGQATFSELMLSHPGEYILSYTVTYPTTANFGVTSTQTITVQPRDLRLVITQQPMLGNTTFILYPYPSINLADSASGEAIMNDRWRNSTWVIQASVRAVSDQSEVRVYEEETMNGQVVFSNIQISSAGEYVIQFTAYTVPGVVSELLPSSVASEQFTIRQHQFAKLDFTYQVDFDSTIGDQEEAFIDQFSARFLTLYPTVEIVNVTLTEGSIIVGVTVTAPNPLQLLSLINHLTSIANFSDLTFTFNNVSLTPSNVTQDPAFVVTVPTLPPSLGEQHIDVILATVIPGGVIIIALVFLLLVCCVVYRHKKRSKSLDLKVN